MNLCNDVSHNRGEKLILYLINVQLLVKRLKKKLTLPHKTMDLVKKNVYLKSVLEIQPLFSPAPGPLKRAWLPGAVFMNFFTGS